MSQDRVTNLYDVMDAAYCSVELQEHCRGLGHVPLIGHNPRGGPKDEFEPADAVRPVQGIVPARWCRLPGIFAKMKIMMIRPP
jgi:hypothetical protein